MALTGKNIICVIGAPGAGKGTLGKRLAEEHGLKHVSVGDVIRKVAEGPTTDKQVRQYILQGELLLKDVLFDILRPEITTGLGESGRAATLVLDGFPRQLGQAKEFEVEFGVPDLVLFFDCPEDLARERVVSRSAGRVNDNLETFCKRYREFLELNPPILEYYAKQGTLVTVDTSTETDVSYGRLVELLRARQEWAGLSA